MLLQMADEPRLGYITDQLKSLSVSASAPPQLQVGALCLAQYSLDNEWYRASVQRVISSDPVNPQYAVIFLDFGNTDRVGGKNVRQIDSALAAVPAQAHSCCLAYLKVSQTGVSAAPCHHQCCCMLSCEATCRHGVTASAAAAASAAASAAVTVTVWMAA